MGKGKRLRAGRKVQDVPALEPGCRNEDGESPQLVTNFAGNMPGTLTVGMMCDWKDGKPLGAADFIDAISDTGLDCVGLEVASEQDAALAEVVFVQGYCPAGGNSACISVLHEMGQNDVDRRIVLPEELEGTDALVVTIAHCGPYLLDSESLCACALSAIEQQLIEDSWFAERYSENRACGMLYITQAADFTRQLHPDALFGQSSIMVVICSSKDELVKYVQLGWPRRKSLLDVLEAVDRSDV